MSAFRDKCIHGTTGAGMMRGNLVAPSCLHCQKHQVNNTLRRASRRNLGYLSLMPKEA